jgi:O-antigen/teichoic acid export membrane protein
MIVSLFTVRVVLKTLGVEDYGIYSVVAGVVEMFSFLSITMASASQRFFAYELGKNNILQLKRTFSITFLIYTIIALIILILSETVGLWFLNNKMIIPTDRINAANFIYQISILSFLITIMNIPYEAIIIARENMRFFAYISVLEVILKLAGVYILVLFSLDKLKLYSFLILVTTCIVTFCYRKLCRRNYEETFFHFYWNKDLFKTLISYSAWSLFGAITSVVNNQGINILLNVFFGPAVNAARAIGYRVSSTISSFSTNFYTAINPQIIKSYASEDKGYMKVLINKSSKFSFFLLLLIALPILVELENILKLWLNETNVYIVTFSRLAIIFALVNSLENPLTQAVRATGNIRKYQITVGFFTLLTFPISYLLLIFRFPPESTIYTLITIYIIALFIRLNVLHKLINFSTKIYWKEVLFKILIVCIFSTILPFILKNKIGEGVLQFFIVETFSFVWILTVIYILGLSKEEKLAIASFTKKSISRLYKKNLVKHLIV